VGLRVLYGMLCSPGLVFARLCLVLLRSYTPAGGWVAVRGVWLFGKLLLFVLCGVFGESVMIDVSRTRRGLMRNYSIFSFLLFLLGLRVSCTCR
jgi:hypothetical protein